VIRLRCTVAAPRARAPEVLDAVTSRLTEVLASIGLTIGAVGVVPGEEPVLGALAPKRDLVAPRIRDALGAGEQRRRPHVWLTLSAGTYLATVVDPYRPFNGDAEEVAKVLGSGRVLHALSCGLTAGAAGVRIVIDAYARRSDLRKLLSLARKASPDGSERSAAR